MAGYSKNIAVIKGLKDGFSADGGAVSGLVKAEKYGRSLKVEVSLINFAPLSEGRFVTALSDGKVTLCVEDNCFEGVSELDTSNGFAALVCYVNGKIFPVASAICGNYRGEAVGIKKELERIENAKPAEKGGAAVAESERSEVYEDEAIAEDNYYEYEDNESESALREDKTQKKDGQKPGQDEAAVGAFKETESGVTGENAAYSGGKSKNEGVSKLASGDFYEKMRGEIENIFSQYPAESSLEKLIEGSRWARISYGESGFYVFGVLYNEKRAEYVCYGVPASNGDVPPESMRGLASFIPAPADGFAGFWVMYQDAKTGASLKIENQ